MRVERGSMRRIGDSVSRMRNFELQLYGPNIRIKSEIQEEKESTSRVKGGHSHLEIMEIGNSSIGQVK
jgi:hypothetical protein